MNNGCSSIRYLALFPLSFSRVLSLSSYMPSFLSIIATSPSISSHDESNRPLFLSILSQFYACSCRVGAFELCCFLFYDIHLSLKKFVIYNSTTDSVIFPFSSSRLLSVSGYLLSGLSMIVASSISGLTYMLELLHTHLGFIFPKVIPCLLVIISHYPVSYILGENIPPREYSLSVDTSV
jgi:hypothetical protein